MSKVYKCDRCGALEPDKADNNTIFSVVSIRRRDTMDYSGKHLCPHCMKKLEDFLSDPNCMETVEEGR